MGKKLTALTILTIVVLAGQLFHNYRKKNKSILPPIDDQIKESAIILNGEQKKSLPQINEKEAKVIYRYKDSNKVWQVLVGQAEDRGQSFKAMGVLHMFPIEGEVETPVYMCVFKLKEHKNLGLDLSSSCGGKGIALSIQPVGYVSKLIRTGYLFAVRCRSPEHGMYVSLNSRCENPTDIFDDFLGAMRAVELR